MLLAAAICCLATGGCATLKSEKALERTAIGMSRCDVIKNLGRPTLVRGVVKNEAGDMIEVWEYRVGMGKKFQQVVTETAFTAMTAGAGAPELLSSAETDRYWFYFVKGSLIGWGRAGDWERDRDRIAVMRFKPGANLAQGI
jgi:hypothetical protein